MRDILLVEDMEEVRELLCQAIAMAGHRVHCVATFKDAEAALASGKYALVIADLRLPDGSGRDLAARAMKSGSRALLISGDPDECEPGALEREIEVLPKPFRLHELTAAIEKHLGT